MLSRLSRSALSACAACALVLGSAAVAEAETTYDPSFGVDGTIVLPQIRGVVGQVTQTCDVSRSRLNIAGRFGSNAAGYPGPWKAGQQLATTSISLSPKQGLSRGVARVQWRKQKIPTGQIVMDSDFDSQGGFAYVTRPTKRSLRQQLKIFRVLLNGHRDERFGRRGFISVTIAGLTAENPPLRVIALPGSKVQLMAQTADTLVILRYTGRGKPDTSWGNSGVVELPAAKHNGYAPLDPIEAATTTPDGGLLVAAGSAPGQPSSGVLGVLKLDAKGAVATSWADQGFWRPPAPGKPVRVDVPYNSVGQTLLTSIRAGGGYAVLYADSADTATGDYSDIKLAYVDDKTGVTTLFNSDAGFWSLDADANVPDAAPWLLRESASGTIAAFAQSSYIREGGLLAGRATRFSADAELPIKKLNLRDPGFAAESFAVDPKAKDLYFCGSLGSTSSKAKNAARRDQRKTVAVRRAKL